jgi:hypothetical protein
MFILFAELLEDIHGLLETPLTDTINVTNLRKPLRFLSQRFHFVNETYGDSSRTRSFSGIKPGNYIIGCYESEIGQELENILLINMMGLHV